jgi:hypothetical protein
VSFRKLLVSSVLVWAVIVLATWLAGEQTEVVRLRTVDEMGKEWSTRLWVVDLDDVTWVRVANPTRAWYLRLLANPRVQFERGGKTETRLALPDASPETVRTVDAAFAAKYGLVDSWYGLLTRRNAVPVRLVSADAEP